VGSAAPDAFRQRATSGELHVTSQRLLSFSALHELIALVAVIELVVAVLPAFVELVTLVEVLELMELVTPVELLTSKLVAADAMFSAEAYAPSASATTATRYLIIHCSNLVRRSR
jgi:uncharacterized membrane protein